MTNSPDALLPSAKEERDSAVLIQQTVKAVCCPLYWNDPRDISKDILKSLNEATEGGGQPPSSR